MKEGYYYQLGKRVYLCEVIGPEHIGLNDPITGDLYFIEVADSIKFKEYNP